MKAPPCSKSWQPQNSPTDSAYQWIKIQECFDTFRDVLEPYKKLILKVLEPATIAWRKQLKSLDARAEYAWPHAREDGTNIFRLDDHIWIWKGLKAIEDIEKSTQSSEDNFNSLKNQTRKWAKEQKTYGSTDVQQKVIRNFTTRNEVWRKRTLAVKRSTRENRFLFHSRDTVLLYAREWGFVPADDINAMEVWQNVMLVQSEHEESQEFTWKSALHYGLSILMALESFSIDKRPCSDIIKDSLAILTQSSSPNGLFPGILDKTTKKGDMSHRGADRDFYFHAGFEISYILFANAHGIIDLWKPKTVPSQERNGIEQETPNKTVKYVAQINSQHTLNGSLRSNIAYLPQDAGTQYQSSWVDTSTMKKSMAVNLSIDTNKVVDVDDEWLYNVPGFLVSGQTTELSWEKVVEKLRVSLELCKPHKIPEWLNRMLEKPPIIITSKANPNQEAAAVFDIAKKSKTEKYEAQKDNPSMLTVDDLWAELVKPRTAELPKKRFIKKRFVWLRSNEKNMALCCYLSSHDEEKTAISKFFNRNEKAEQFFYDETTMFLNTWETELHLSFYKLLRSGNSTLSCKGAKPGIDFTFPRTGGCTITKVSTGFRFLGDFFDRSWTCHLIGPIYEKDTEWDLWLKDPSNPCRTSKQKAWGQRKVLELHLFERFLTALVSDTRELFEALKKEVKLDGYGKQIFLINHMNDYYPDLSGDWEDLEQSLKHIIDELERVKGTIVRWRARESERGPERPRWTWNDETKYRRAISKLRVSTDHKVQEFTSLHLEIKAFREWLMRYQEQIREEISFRSAENIKFLTYVTVVFLPLGFASSIFSMSAVPEQDLVHRMVTVAIVALIIIILAIKSAPVINSGFNQMTQKSVLSQAMRHTIELCRSNSVLFWLNARQVENENAGRAATDDTIEALMQSLGYKQNDYGGDTASTLLNSSRKNGLAKPINANHQPNSQQPRSATDIWIWLRYILTEIPVRIVVSACDRLSRGDMSTTTFFNVVLGITVLPWGLIALMANIIVVNIAELVSIIVCELIITSDGSIEILLT